MMLRVGCALVGLVWLTSPVSARAGKDVVILKNGDRLTGEIKKLEDGLLYFSVSYVDGDIPLDWAQVERMESPQQFEFEFIDGDILVGFIRGQAEMQAPQAEVSIAARGSSKQVPKDKIAHIRQMEGRFWQRVSTSLDLGVSFAKGNSLKQVTLGGQFKYKEPQDTIQVTWSSLFSTQAEANDTDRRELKVSYARTLAKRKNWFGLALADFLSNNEQQLNLRTTLGGGLGRYLIR